MSLIISRRIGESFLLGNDILITIYGVHANQARIAIKAPKDLLLYREEIYLKILQQEDPVLFENVICKGVNHSRIFRLLQQCEVCDKCIFKIVTHYEADIAYCFHCKEKKTIIAEGNTYEN